MSRRPIGLRTLAAGVALVLAVSACGSDDETTTSQAAPASDATTAPSATDAAPAGTDAAPAGTDAAPAGTDAAPSGAPIKLATFSPTDSAGHNEPGVTATAKMVEEWVNANGGVNGHPLEISTCNEKNDPNEAEACARKAVDDGVVAVVGTYTLNDDRINPVLEEAGIPNFGPVCFGCSPTDLTSTNVYTQQSGVVAGFFGAGVAAGKNCEKIAAVRYDVAASEQTINIVSAGLASEGKELSQTVTVPLTATDLAPQAAAADEGGTDCITVSLGAEGMTAFMAAMVQGGYTQRIFATGGVIDQTAVDNTGGADSPAEGATLVATYPGPDNPDWDEWQQAKDAYTGSDKDTIVNDGRTVGNTWLAYQLLIEVLKTIDGDIDAASVKAALESSSGIQYKGLTQPFDWTKDGPIPGMPNIVNGVVYHLTVKDGKIVSSDNEPEDLTAAMVKAFGG